MWADDSCGVQVRRSDRFFGKFTGCAGFFTLLSEADAAMSINPSRRVFFGPRMEFLYARDRIEAPEGLPLWWHPGSSYPEESTAKIVERWKAARFDLLVFAHNDRTRIPQQILNDIDQNYREVPALSGADGDPEAHADVFIRRSSR